jgi:DNA-directed RNA polymerase omega subunit
MQSVLEHHLRRFECPMAFVALEDILMTVGNRYMAVIVAAKEARRINQQLRKDPGEEGEPVAKPTTEALRRVSEGLVKYHERPDDAEGGEEV